MNDQITREVKSYSHRKNQQGCAPTWYAIIFFLVASGLLYACKDYPGIPAPPPSFSETFFKTYRSFGAMGVVPRGVSPDSVCYPSNFPDSSKLILRNDNTYSMKAKFSITMNRGSHIDTLTCRIDEQGDLQVKSAKYYDGHDYGEKGWAGKVRFVPANGIAWECKYELFDWDSMEWVLTLWGPIWLRDSSFVTGFSAHQ